MKYHLQFEEAVRFNVIMTNLLSFFVIMTLIKYLILL